MDIKSILKARAALITAAQETKATTNGYSKGKHYCTALIRAFVTARTKKRYSNESNSEYYCVVKIRAENGHIVCDDVAGFCQHSALVAREEKSASAKAGAAEGARLATAESEDVAYEWLVFSSENEPDETKKMKGERLEIAHKLAIEELQKSLNTPSPKMALEPERKARKSQK